LVTLKILKINGVSYFMKYVSFYPKMK